jgi:hypothetical protein
MPDQDDRPPEQEGVLHRCAEYELPVLARVQPFFPLAIGKFKHNLDIQGIPSFASGSRWWNDRDDISPDIGYGF